MFPWIICKFFTVVVYETFESTSHGNDPSSSQVSDMDAKIYGLRHFSKWLVFADVKNLQYLTNLTIDNVAAVVPVKQQLDKQKVKLLV